MQEGAKTVAFLLQHQDNLGVKGKGYPPAVTTFLATLTDIHGAAASHTQVKSGLQRA